jgi:hypothetical protein
MDNGKAKCREKEYVKEVKENQKCLKPEAHQLPATKMFKESMLKEKIHVSKSIISAPTLQ